MPLTNTVKELPDSFALCGTHLGGFKILCGATRSPLRNIALPLANTVNCEHSTGAVGEHACPVRHLSLCLDIAGMTLFIADKNSLDYNLNLLN